MNEASCGSTDILERVYDKELFFIVGVPKSGTTWLQRLLDAHPGIVCRGEAHFVDIFHVQMSKALDQYNRTVQSQGGVVAHLARYGGHVESLCYDVNDYHYMLVLAMALMFDKWIASDNIQVIGEKTPDNLMSIKLLSTIFPSAKFVHIIRDGRDCAVSGWFFQRSGVDKNKRIIQTFEQYVRAFANTWQVQVNQGRNLGARLGDRYQEIRYERLLEDAHGEMKRLLGFLGVDDWDRNVADCVAAAEFPVLSGGRNPGEEDVRSFYRKGTTGDWKNHFSESLAVEFHQIAGGTLESLGYG